MPSVAMACLHACCLHVCRNDVSDRRRWGPFPLVPLAKFMRFGAAAPSQHTPPRHHSRRSYRLAPRALQPPRSGAAHPRLRAVLRRLRVSAYRNSCRARVGELPRAGFVPVALDHTGSALRHTCCRLCGSLGHVICGSRSAHMLQGVSLAQLPGQDLTVACLVYDCAVARRMGSSITWPW